MEKPHHATQTEKKTSSSLWRHTGVGVVAGGGEARQATGTPQAAEVTRRDLLGGRALQNAGPRQRLPHASGGAREVQLSRLDAGSLGGGVDVERLFPGGKAEAVSAGFGSNVLGALAANTPPPHAGLVFLRCKEVLHGGDAGGRAVHRRGGCLENCVVNLRNSTLVLSVTLRESL